MRKIIERSYEEIERENLKLLDLVRRLSDHLSLSSSRRTGKTARMLLRALIALSAGHDVAVVGLNPQRALAMKVDIERHCRTWNIPYDGGPWRPHGDHQARGDDRAPLVRAATPSTDLEGFRGVTLVDHAVIEQMEAAAGVEPVAEEVI